MVLRELCQRIPCDTDLLLTHAPPRGFLDEVTVIETTTNEYTGQKKTSRRIVHCGELEVLQRQLALKAEAEAKAVVRTGDGKKRKGAAALPPPERWPCCCHIFGHVSQVSWLHSIDRPFKVFELATTLM